MRLYSYITGDKGKTLTKGSNEKMEVIFTIDKKNFVKCEMKKDNYGKIYLAIYQYEDKVLPLWNGKTVIYPAE